MHLGTDIRYAFRQIRRSPGFAITAVLTLALGIGATTAIFSLIYVSMLKPLPVRDPAQLYKVGRDSICCSTAEMQGDWDLFSNDLYDYLRDHTRGFEGGLIGFQAGQTPMLVHRQGEQQLPVLLQGKFVSGNYFRVLGVPMAKGRALTPQDDRPGAPPVLVLSDRMWQRRLGGDPHILGQTLMMNGAAATIVGVAAPGFLGESTNIGDMAELWLPLRQETTFVHEGAMGPHPEQYWLEIMGRVAHGASTASLDAQLNTGLRQWLESRAATMQPEERAHIGRQYTEVASAEAGINYIGIYYERSLKALMVAAGFVMLIVCANVANLLLVRAMGQTQQTSVRMAIGATRRQLLQQAMVSSLVLALLGCVAAIGIAYLLSSSVLGIALQGIDYIPVTARPSLPMLGFAFATAAITAILFGVGPAWLSTRNNLATVLRASTRTTRSSGSAPQRLLVITQAALSVVLLCAAGLLTSSLTNLQRQDFGRKTQGRYVAFFDSSLADYRSSQLNDLYRKLHARLMAIPGAQQAGIANSTGLAYGGRQTLAFFPGKPDPAPDSEWGLQNWLRISPDFFAAIGATLREGRAFSDTDTDASRKVAIVNETFANRYLDGHALGQRFGIEPQLRSQFEIVGVVKDIKFINPDKPVPPMFFLPLTQTTQVFSPDRISWEARTHTLGDIALHLPNSNRAAAESAIRHAIADVDPNLPITDYYTYQELVGFSFVQGELMARLCALFAGIALVLAGIGIYGVTAYSVERRTGEIGIRMALGASRFRILSEVLRHSLLFCGIGLVLGIPLAYLAGRMLADRLYGVSAFDAPVVFLAVLLLALCAAAAALLPARRAASIDPMKALRQD